MEFEQIFIGLVKKGSGMKHVLRLYAITLLFSAGALKDLQARDIKVSKIISQLIGTPAVDVKLIQDGKSSDGRITSAFSDKLTFDPDGGKVTLEARIIDEYGVRSKSKSDLIPSSDLIGKQIRIGDQGGFRTQKTSEGPKRVRAYDLTFKIEWADAPSTKQIRAFKTTQDKVDWTVVITDNKDTEITKKTFKKNTGDLYLQLNSYEITKTDDPNIVYNANKISVFRGKDITVPPLFPAKTVKWNEFDSAKPELEISATGANFVEKGSEKKSKIPDKKIRAYKTVEDKFDWTVQITDNSDNEISHSTFKKNTDGLKTRSLYLRLNSTEITDGSESQKRYNVNKVKVFKGKKIIGTPFIDKHITVANFNAISDGELQISDDDATLVAKGLEKK